VIMTSKLSITFVCILFLSYLRKSYHELIDSADLITLSTFEESSRLNGEICGSCNTSIGCNYNTIDESCSSKYCDNFGQCRAFPECDIGQYLEMNTLTCQFCPAGSYGNSRGLYDSACSGACHEGFYCLKGSTSPTEFMCSPNGDPRYYCPENSAFPLEAAAGYYTINSPSQYVANNDTDPGTLHNHCVLVSLD
jgi:hypothetical protein